MGSDSSDTSVRCNGIVFLVVRVTFPQNINVLIEEKICVQRTLGNTGVLFLNIFSL